jgi:hypothetical protein
MLTHLNQKADTRARIGFTSTQVFERAGPIIDPFYHKSGDVSNRTDYDLDQVHAIAKVTVSTRILCSILS